MLRIIYTILFFFVSFCSLGQEWKSDYLQAAAAYNNNELKVAAALAESALAKYTQSSGATNANYAAILRLLSSICYSQERFSDGLGYAQKELAILEYKKDTTYATALSNQAQFYRQLSKYQQAIESLLLSQQIFSQFYKEHELPLIDCKINLAINYYLNNDIQKSFEYFSLSLTEIENAALDPEDKLEAFYYYALLNSDAGRTEVALTSFLKTKQLYETANLQNTTNYALVLLGLGQCYHQANLYAKAEQSYLAAQMLYESLAGKEGDDYFKIVSARAANLQKGGKQAEAEALLTSIKGHPGSTSAYALSINNSATYYQAKGDYEKAEKLYQEALSYLHQEDRESLSAYAHILQNLGMMYSDKGDQELSLARLSEAQPIIEKLYGINHKEYIIVLNKLGIALTKSGRTAEAKAVYRQIIQIHSMLSVKPTNEMISAYLGLAELKRRNGEYGSADSIYHALIAAYYPDKKHADANYLLTMNNLAALKQTQGQLAAARDVMKTGLAATKSIHGPSSLAYGEALENLALLRMRLGDLSPVKAELDSCLLIYKSVAGVSSAHYADGMLSIGRYFQITGDYTKAEPYLKGARDILKTTNGSQSASYASSLNSLALLYQTLGNYRDAGQLLQEAKSIFEKLYGKSNAEYSTATQNLATLYQLQGQLDVAEPLFKEALEIDRKVLGENHPQYAISLQNLATLYQKLGRSREAEETLNRALTLTKATLGQDHPSYATTLSNLAAFYQDKGDFVRAEATWRESVDLRKKILGENHPDYTRSLFGLAGVYHALHQWEKAKQYYEPVVSDYQKQVRNFFPSLSEKEKGAFYAKIKPVFDAYQDFCVQYLFANPASRAAMAIKLYDLQLSTKAILLNASNKVRSRILTSGDVQLQGMFSEWLSLKEQMVRHYNYTKEERDKLSIDLTVLEGRANDLEKLLSQKSDGFKSQFEKEEIRWKEVQKSLREGEAGIEIVRIKKKYTQDSVYYIGLVLRAASEGPELMVWPKGSQLESRLYKFHRNTIKYHLRDTSSYRYFWQPLNEKLSGVNTIYLSCDGVFNKVNFNSLYNASSKRWVIDDFTIRLVSNTRELAEERRVASYTKSASIFGFADFNLGVPNVQEIDAKRSLARVYGFEGGQIPVLPATEKEVDGVQKILVANQWSSQIFKKQEATEENMKKVIGAEVIHIATHGFFLSDVEINENETSELLSNPLFRSGVLLAGAAVEKSSRQSQEDGVLTAYEAMNLNLDKTDLVVLSACETGLGEIRNGEGVYGLQRSFLVAGANSVLMSLWQVDDVATQELMNLFYSYWLEGQERNKAFRKAQLAMKEKYDVPYFWGAFVLIGL